MHCAVVSRAAHSSILRMAALNESLVDSNPLTTVGDGSSISDDIDDLVDPDKLSKSSSYVSLDILENVS